MTDQTNEKGKSVRTVKEEGVRICPDAWIGNQVNQW